MCVKWIAGLCKRLQNSFHNRLAEGEGLEGREMLAQRMQSGVGELTRQREISLANGERYQIARETDCHPTIQRLRSIVTHSRSGGAFRDN
jgi:hypothetical protein